MPVELIIPGRQSWSVPTEVPDGDRSPQGWLRNLERRLDRQAVDVSVFDAYYEGRHPMAFASEKFRDAFGGLFREFADNWCALVVDAVEERLNIDGFRFGATSDEPDAVETDDKDAWAIWQQNMLDAESQVAHTEALINGVSYVLVWPDIAGQPQITVEHPSQVIVAHDPGNRRRRLAALKRWVEDDGTARAVLYLPDEIYKWRTLTRWTSSSKARWVEWAPNNEMWPSKNPLGVVPMVPLTNRRRMLAEGCSELRDVIPVQNAVNKLVADMMVASEFGAFRQRWVTGLDIPRDPVTNAPIEPFKAAVNRLWMGNPPKDQNGAKIEGASEVRFGEFDQTDLTPFVKAIELLVQHVASQTRTPPHYFYLSGQFPSGESIKSAETGLVSKGRRKMRHFGESWEEVMRLAFLVLGDQRRANALDAETIWKDPESRTEGEHIDAVGKKRQMLHIPLQQAWEDAGYSPKQRERMRGMLDQETALAAALGDFSPLAGPAEE